MSASATQGGHKHCKWRRKGRRRRRSTTTI